jgi:hypothetical protein
MAQSLSELVKANKVTVAAAERVLSDPNELRGLLRGVA